jgi:SAM-dependent methyltransferase
MILPVDFNISREDRERKHFDYLANSDGEIWWGSITPAGLKRLKRRASIVLKEIGGFMDPSVLEIGCGTGAFSSSVLEEIPSLHLTACDISPKCIEVARSRLGKFRNALFEVANVTSMVYSSNSFDAIIGNSVLHHLPVYLVLKECYRILKPGGKVLFFEPNMANPQILIEKNIYFIGRMLQNSPDETAFLRFPLAKSIRKCGFNNVSVEPFDFLHPALPVSVISIFESVGSFFEKTPILREISGSLIVKAYKPKYENQ